MQSIKGCAQSLPGHAPNLGTTLNRLKMTDAHFSDKNGRCIYIHHIMEGKTDVLKEGYEALA